eukprot:scaffold4195_cov250-Pinguiococcus_pyrenoidosus.AAC.7
MAPQSTSYHHAYAESGDETPHCATSRPSVALRDCQLNLIYATASPRRFPQLSTNSVSAAAAEISRPNLAPKWSVAVACIYSSLCAAVATMFARGAASSLWRLSSRGAAASSILVASMCKSAQLTQNAMLSSGSCAFLHWFLDAAQALMAAFA